MQYREKPRQSEMYSSGANYMKAVNRFQMYWNGLGEVFLFQLDDVIDDAFKFGVDILSSPDMSAGDPKRLVHAVHHHP